MANKTFKAFVDKMGGVPASSYIGNEGELFYDPTTTTLRVSDGSTPGGTIVSSGGGGGNPFDQDLNTSNNVTFNEVTANNVYFDNLNLTGNVFVSSACSAINFVANSSGDGAGASTIELIPDTNLSGTDQYLIIDPTAPGHIHIRAGGIQDGSSADLFIGGEYSYLKVHAGANSEVSVTANSHQFRFGQSGYGVLQFPNLTYADLPQSPDIIAGQRAFINDANIAASGNFGATVSGGGANNTPVWSDGVNWYIG